MKKHNISSLLLYKKLLAEGQRLVALENENFLAILMGYAWKISELIIHRDKKVTNKLKVFYRFGKYIVYLNKKQGTTFTVKYLKASLLAIQRAIAGSPVKSLREIEPDLPLPRLSTSGLPVWIGTRDRRAILSGSTSVIQFYLSLFSVYRVIDAPVKAKLNTITDPFSGSPEFMEGSLGFFKHKFKRLIRCPSFNLKGPKGREAGLLLLQSSSSTNSISWQGWAFDAWLIRSNSALYALTRKWLELTQNFELLSILNMSRSKPLVSKWVWRYKDKDICLSLVRNTFDLLRLASIPFKTNSSRRRNNSLFFTLDKGLPTQRKLVFKRICLDQQLDGLRDNYALGRLSFKVEAAGKLRVFAMVDSWTQSILKPLHDSLFKVLSLLPNDSTFNQGAAFKRAVSKAEKSGHSYGFDLSAATDRLPLIIQIKLLSGFIGDHLASLWGLILTERDYYLPENKFGIPEGNLRYAVGQPMGALSSWAMLALTHHAIVQYANYLLGNKNNWTEAYEVLGDDIVIFDPSLAKKYEELMGLYGVELNMAKSVISHGKQPVVEFAKRTSFKGKDVSPLSLKMFLNQDSFAGRLSIFAFWSTRIESHFIPAFKTIMKRVRWDDRPGKDKFALLGLLSLSVTKGVLPFEWLLKEMKDKRAYFIRKGKMVLTNFPTEWGFKVSKSILEGKDIATFEPRNSHSFMFEQRWYKVAIIRRMTSLISKYQKVDPFVFKKFILTRLGIGGQNGVFVHHLWLPKFDDVIANPFLLLRFYSGLVLSKYSLKMLIRFLDELEGAASILAVFKQSRTQVKTLADNLKFLQFIDKTIKAGFRTSVANQKLALESSWDQITDKKAPTSLWLGVSGSPSPRPLIPLSDKQRWMMFGEPIPESKTSVIDESSKLPEPIKRSFTLWWTGFLGLLLIILMFYLGGEEKQKVSSPFIKDDWPSPSSRPLFGGVSMLDWLITLFLVSLLFLPLLSFLYASNLVDEVVTTTNNEIINYCANINDQVSTLPVGATRASFVFPQLRELIEWQAAQNPVVVRSPEIGFGWTEPWVQNTDWPEAWR